MRARTGLIDIEFMVSIMVFLTVITFVVISILNNIPRLHQETLSQDLKSKSFQLSELLLFESGWPPNWDTEPVGNVDRIGLSNGTKYYMELTKMAQLESFCSTDYGSVKDLMGLDFRNDIIIEVVDLSSTVLLTCEPAVVSQIRPIATTMRIGLNSLNGILIMRVSIL